MEQNTSEQDHWRWQDERSERYWSFKTEAALAERVAAFEAQRPSVLYRPSLGRDGNMWCALYGANLMEGVYGFGESPEAAMTAFDVSWTKKIAEGL